MRISKSLIAAYGAANGQAHVFPVARDFTQDSVTESPNTALLDSDREHRSLQSQVKRTRATLLGEQHEQSFAEVLADVSMARSNLKTH